MLASAPRDPVSNPPNLSQPRQTPRPTLQAGFLLYTALCPQQSAMHNGPLRAALSWRRLRPIADHSFAINMLHFRILLDLALRGGCALAPPGTPQLAPEALSWAHVAGLYAATLAVSAAAAAAVAAAEPAVRRALGAALVLGLEPLAGPLGSWVAIAGRGKAGCKPARSAGRGGGEEEEAIQQDFKAA